MHTGMAAPQPVKAVSRGSSSELIQLERTDVTKLDGKVHKYFDRLTSGPANIELIRNQSRHIQKLGEKEIQRSTAISSKLLDRPTGTMMSGLFDDSSSVSRALIDLRETVADLDPSNHHTLLTPRKLFGIIPLKGNIKKYFKKFQSAQTRLNTIICSLNDGRDDLLMDNAIIEEERIHMLQAVKALERYVYFGKKLDSQLSTYIGKIERTDPESARLFKEEFLFFLRQKIQDLLTQLSVSMQGYLVMNIIVKNNLELVRGIDNSTNTTISALKTAVTVVQALANEKLVLEQIQAINEATGDLIEGTSKAMKKHASKSRPDNKAIELNKMSAAFENIYEAIDMIDQHKIDALENMKVTINVLNRKADKAKRYLIKSASDQIAAGDR
jgi:uncharacterized protein YaaN involved in tellurite resistance